MQDLTSKNGLDARSDYLLQWLDADTDTPVDDSQLIANGGTPAGGEDDQGFAARLYRLCLHALRKVYIRNRGRRTFGSPSTGLRECLGRLYLWGESFGQGELDKALEESDDLKESVLERLGHIGKLLLRELPTTIAPSRGLPQPSEQTIELESLIKQTNDVTSGHKEGENPSGDDSDEDYDSGTEGLSDGESHDLCEDIGFSITCLAELRDSLEQNLIRAEKNRSQNKRPPPVSFCLSDPAKIYVSLVREKFGQAEDQLVERLGQANWQRHVGVRKRTENNIGVIEEVPEPACSVFRPYSTFHDSGIGTSVPTRTSYAPSHTSFVSSNTEGGQDSLRVPPMPSEVGVGKPFQCEFCGMLLSNIKNRVDWKMHVFADLQPYICTFANCEDELTQFPTRAAWSDHEFAEHRVTQQWGCPECSNIYARTVDWEDHLQRDHECFFTGSKLQVALGMALHRKSRTAENEECPLCRTILGKPRRAFVKHVGRHMEEIALMALPQNAEDGSDEGSISSNENPTPTADRELASAILGCEAKGAPEDFHAALERVINILWDYDEYSTPFLTPVKYQEAPDYYDIIEKPMDLSTIKDKLDHHWYTSRSEFVSDINLIWGNCLQYNTALEHPLRRKALAMRQKTKKLVPSIPNFGFFDGFFRAAAPERIDGHSYDDEDSDDEPIMSSRGHPTLARESKSSVDRLAPRISGPLPQTIRAQDVAGAVSNLVYEDGSTSKKSTGGEAPNAQWGVTKAGKPRKPLTIACMSCRKRKIKCDAAKPKCDQCERFGRVCIYQRPSLVSNDDLKESYETRAHVLATHHSPVLSQWSDSETTLKQSKNEVDGSISIANKEHQCPYCSTSFNRHHNLKSHLLTHNQDEPYACDTCETRFRRLHDLKRHNKVHTPEPPRVCLECNRSFARADKFVSHTKNGCTQLLASKDTGLENLSDHESPSTNQHGTAMQHKASRVHAQKLAKSPPQSYIPTQEYRVSSQPRPDSLGGPTRLSPKDSLLNDNTVQNYAKGFLTNKSTSHQGGRQRGHGNEQHHTSLTRERHPIYGNSIFSENRSVYRTDDTSDRFTNEFERDAAKESTLPTYTYPGGRRKGQKTRSTSVDPLENIKWSQEPSDATVAAASGSAYKLKSLMYGDEAEQSENSPELFKCSHTDCVEQPPLFSRRSEWAKHMDMHTRPYLCAEPECNGLLGFTYLGGLFRHQHDVHGFHGGSTARLNCTQQDCEWSAGVGVARKDHLKDRLGRDHDALEEELQRLHPNGQVDDELKGQSKRSEKLNATRSRVIKDFSERASPKKTLEPSEQEKELKEATKKAHDGNFAEFC